MNLDYIIPNNWSIIEKGFNPDHVKASESLFSIGNGVVASKIDDDKLASTVKYRC